MANSPDYVCSNCKREVPRELLTVKRATFMQMGAGARTLRSRVKGWLCEDCIAMDPDWNQEELLTPGNEAKKERLASHVQN